MKLYNNDKGYAMGIFIIGLSVMLGSVMLAVFLFSLLRGEIEAFKSDAEVDCFLAGRAAVLQLKSEYEKSGYEGEFDVDRWKNYFRSHLASIFNLDNYGGDVLIAKSDNMLINYAEIQEYDLDTSGDDPEITSCVDFTVRMLFYSDVLPKPVYRIRTVIKLNYLQR